MRSNWSVLFHFESTCSAEHRSVAELGALLKSSYLVVPNAILAVAIDSHTVQIRYLSTGSLIQTIVVAEAIEKVKLINEKYLLVCTKEENGVVYSLITRQIINKLPNFSSSEKVVGGAFIAGKDTQNPTAIIWNFLTNERYTILYGANGDICPVYGSKETFVTYTTSMDQRSTTYSIVSFDGIKMLKQFKIEKRLLFKKLLFFEDVAAGTVDDSVFYYHMESGNLEQFSVGEEIFNKIQIDDNRVGLFCFNCEDEDDPTTTFHVWNVRERKIDSTHWQFKDNDFVQVLMKNNISLLSRDKMIQVMDLATGNVLRQIEQGPIDEPYNTRFFDFLCLE